MQLQGHDIAICSWSLQPKGMQDLAAKVKELGLQHVQLALLDLVMLDDKRKYEELGHLRAAGIQYSGGMFGFAGEDYSSIERIRETGGFVPDADWPLRKRLAIEGAKLAKELGMTTILAHVGFVPPHTDAKYKGIVDRIRELAAALAEHGQSLVMETGQEPASELLEFFKDLKAPNVHINFDPANMILYGAGDPIEAIKILGPHIKHVHVKDATPSSKPGVDWGAEVPFGTGKVGAERFIGALKQVGYKGPLAIEREAGNDRMGDVKIAIGVLKKILA
jgi:sugar phosphate isomerase/epimerase